MKSRQSKSKAEWIVFSVKFGVRASSLALTTGAVVAFETGHIGEGLQQKIAIDRSGYLDKFSSSGAVLQLFE